MIYKPANQKNYKKGRSSSIDLIVIHTMEGSLNGSVSWFQNPDAKVSAHYLVGKNGDIVQMVKDEDTAWHCIGVNSRSIGIEHEGYESFGNFPVQMLEASAKLVSSLCKGHKIPIDRRHIMGHNEVPNNNHKDPGKFWDWDVYMEMVRNASK